VGGCRASVSGTVMDPAGVAPIYNAIVYVPGAAVLPIPDGVSCDRCGASPSGQPVALTLSASDGTFQLDGVPPGNNVPLVIQLGKWRRQVSIPSVAACVDNPITDINLTRLPRSSAEGHLPQIALVTGRSDPLECILRRIGIADSEFTNDSGTGRIHMYAGGIDATTQGATQLAGGAVFSGAYTALFPSPQKLASYDLLLLACEGSQLASSKIPYVANIKSYADRGGRVIAEHLQSYWISHGATPWPNTAQWLQSIDSTSPTTITATIDTTFPRGAAFGDWLTAADPSTTPGQIAFTTAQHSVDGIVAPTQRWIYSTSSSSISTSSPTEILTFNTPVEAPIANQCGRVTFVDLHSAVATGSASPAMPFPTGCSSTSVPSPEQRAMEFMFFDAAACAQSDTADVVAPGSGGGGPEPDVLTGKKALLVVDMPSALDDSEAALKADFEARGMTVTVATVDGPASLADGQDLIVGSSSAAPDLFATTFKDVTVPILVFGNGYDVPLGMVASGTGNTGSVPNATLFTVVGAGTPLAGDLAMGTVFTAIDPSLATTLVTWATPGGSPIRVAAVSATPNQVAAFAFEKGSPMATGTATQRRVALGWRTNSFSVLNLASYKLTVAAIKWAANAPP